MEPCDWNTEEVCEAIVENQIPTAAQRDQNGFLARHGLILKLNSHGVPHSAVSTSGTSDLDLFPFLPVLSIPFLLPEVILPPVAPRVPCSPALLQAVPLNLPSLFTHHSWHCDPTSYSHPISLACQH